MCVKLWVACLLLHLYIMPLPLQVGSNIGVHSLHVAASGFPVVAVEGFPPTAARISCSKLMNGFESLVVVPSAVGAVEGDLCFDTYVVNVGGTNAMANHTGCLDIARSHVRPLDSILDNIETQMGRVIGPPALVKIDVEGEM